MSDQNQKNKIIFITVSRAITARNLLLNNFIQLLKEQYKIVLLVSNYNDPEFREIFKEFIIEPLYDCKLFSWKRRLDIFLVSLGKAMIYNPTIELRSRYGLQRRAKVHFKKIRLFLQKYIIKPIFGYAFFRASFRAIDAMIFSEDRYDELIKKYKPTLLLATSLSDPNDIALIRNAKKHSISTIGMLKSWDNASKFLLREKTSHVLVWSQYMAEEVIKFQDYKINEVIITGVPQFDYYKNLDIPLKADFFAKFKMDINKKTIFFGSEGPVSNNDPYVVRYLKKKIQDATLANYQILVRPHFSYAGDENRFIDLVDNEHVFLDNDYQRSNFKDGIALSLTNVINLMAAIRYSDASITSASTLVLDIIANGRYPILYNFDENKTVDFANSIKRLYMSLWMQEILQVKLDNLVNSEEELINKIKELEVNPQLAEEARNQVITRFCYKVDGQSGRRVFEFINNKF